MTLAALLGVLICPQPALGQSPSFGPLTTEDGGPLQRISYTATTEAPEPLARGSIRADLWMGFSNVFEQDSSATHWLFMDMERLITTTTVRVGVSDRLELGARATFETTGGGALDSFVSWWHTRLSVGNANRERYPEDRYDQRLVGANDEILLDIPQRTLGLEELRLSAKWLAAASGDGRKVVSLRGTARIPAQSNTIGREGTDVALSALGRISFTRWHLHGMLEGSTARASGRLGQLMRDRYYSLMFGAERSFGSWSLLTQYSFHSPVLKSFSDREIDWPSGNLALGATGRWGEEWLWDVSFQEDLPADTPAADFTLGFRLSRTW